jgi:hypothetical protein
MYLGNLINGSIEAVNRTFARFYSKNRSAKMCSADLTYWACDHPSTTFCATCRKNLCNQHAVKIGWETFCLQHAAEEEKRVKEMFGIQV